MSSFWILQFTPSGPSGKQWYMASYDGMIAGCKYANTFGHLDANCRAQFLILNVTK